MMMALTDELVGKIRDQLVEVLHPQRIYLFGSHAYGQPTPESDIDLLVVVPPNGERMLDLEIKARRAIGMNDVPIDILVYPSDQFDHRASWRANFEHTVRSKGRLIYGK